MAQLRLCPALGESPQPPVALAAHGNPDDVQRLQRRIDGGRSPRCLVRIDRDDDPVGAEVFVTVWLFLPWLDRRE